MDRQDLWQRLSTTTQYLGLGLGNESENVNDENGQENHLKNTQDRFYEGRTSLYENTSLNPMLPGHGAGSVQPKIILPGVGAIVGDVKQVLKSQTRKRQGHHLKHALDKYFRELLQNGNKSLPNSFVDASKNLPLYLDNSIREVFYQLDASNLGKVSMEEFACICEIMDINIDDGEKMIFSNEYCLSQNKNRKDQMDFLWTVGQRPFWDLCVNKNKKSLNAEEFTICLLEHWAAKNYSNRYKGMQDKQENNNKDRGQLKLSKDNPVLKRRYKKVGTTRKNQNRLTDKTNDNSGYFPIQNNYKNKKDEKLSEKSILQQTELKSLNKLIEELGSLLQLSDANNISLQVFVKKQTKKEDPENEVTGSHEEEIETFMKQFQTNKDNSSQAEKKCESFDKQLNELIKLEEEFTTDCLQSQKTKGSCEIEFDFLNKQPMAIDYNNRICSKIQYNKYQIEENQFQIESGEPRKRTNSEVAEHRAKASEALQALNKANAEVNTLR